MIRILLADDHALVREGLKQLFSLTTDIVIAAGVTNGMQVLKTLSTDVFDVLLLDMTMPGVSGTDLITRVVTLTPHPPVLVLSMHNEPQIARRALAAGAMGYLTKDCDPSTLLTAVRRVAGGGRYIDPVMAEFMAFEHQDKQAAGGHQHLSNREFQVLCLLASGKSVNDIAQELSISNKTVSTHKARLMEKMSFSNNAEIVRYAMDRRLIA
ncbi:response regulator [Acidovorax facilis]|uniref:response regulator n=1 Tax=Acidovorax facilis TaxID=12917 RepID=UPI003CEDCA26